MTMTDLVFNVTKHQKHVKYLHFLPLFLQKERGLGFCDFLFVAVKSPKPGSTLSLRERICS